MTADDPRVQRARDVLHDLSDLIPSAMMRREVGEALDGLLAVVDERHEERDRLQRWKDEAIPVMLGLQDLGRALDVPPGKRITGEVAVEVAKNLVAERDRLLAVLSGEAARHDPADSGDGWTLCESCWQEWPCPVVRAADGDDSGLDHGPVGELS